MLSYVSASSSASASPRICASPSPRVPSSSGHFQGTSLIKVHSVTPPPSTLAKSTPNKACNSLGPSVPARQYSNAPYLSRGTFDYESEGSTYPAKKMNNVSEALKELEEILMGDVESSSEESSDSELEMEIDQPRSRPGGQTSRQEPPVSPGVGIISGRRESMMARNRPTEKPSKGWSKGVARESPTFQVVVDVPCWEPGCYSDLSSMQALRDSTLKALHDLIDSLRLRGVRTNYRLHSTANGGAWGCIRVAPFMSPSSVTQSSLTASPVSERKPIKPWRSVTLAGSLPASSLSTCSSSRSKSTADKGMEDEKERVARRVKRALETDGLGCVQENRSYLLPVNGQPALVIT